MIHFFKKSKIIYTHIYIYIHIRVIIQPKYYSSVYDLYSGNGSKNRARPKSPHATNLCRPRKLFGREVEQNLTCFLVVFNREKSRKRTKRRE